MTSKPKTILKWTMPGRETHKIVGGLTGATAAFLNAQNQPLLPALAEIFGGWLAGQHAGTWPDAAEPSISSHHRDVCHAIAPSFASATLLLQQVESLQGALRSQAQAYFQLAATTNDGSQQTVSAIAGLFLHVLAGSVPAIPAGYLSHVALDAATARGVPLLIRGF
jgi:membrane-bound metal-dependent hydrolase YbcI (DUF457 family)